MSGRWLREAIEQALSRSQCSPGDIGTLIGNACGVRGYDHRELQAIRSVFGEATMPESVNRQVGVLESACGLLSVAAAAARVEQLSGAKIPAANSRANHLHANKNDRTVGLAEPAAAMVCASSETGRNTCVVLKSAS